MLLTLALLVAACTPDSRYDLHIEPITPLNLDMVLGSPDLTLVHRSGGNADLFPLGPAADAEFGDLPPLQDGQIGLLLTPPATASDSYDPNLLLAYGEAPLGGALGNDGEARTIDVLVSEFAGAGELGELQRRAAPLLGAGAFLPDGVAVLFGGQRDGEPHAAISVLSGLPTDFAFRDVEPLPEATVLLTATPLADGTILVVGGRPEYFTISDNSRFAGVWDPAVEAFVWSNPEAMATGRSRHVAVPMRDGRVLVVGGWQGPAVTSDVCSYQFFDPTRQRFQDAGEVDASPLGVMATSLGGDGALVCGGFEFDIDAEVLRPNHRCERITVTGDPIPFDDLPEPMGLGALTALPGGKVLLAGGVLDPIPVPLEDGFLVGQNTGTATDRAWIHEPETGWRELGPLVEARAAAAAVPSGDGRIVLVGGAQQAGPLISDDRGSVFCPEVFDPDTERFVAGGSCSTPGAGAFPIVSSQPTQGIFAVEGHRVEDGEEAGGQSYGIIGLAPPL